MAGEPALRRHARREGSGLRSRRRTATSCAATATPASWSRAHQHARARASTATTEPVSFGATRNPWDAAAHRRRFERRVGGRGRRRVRAGRARERRRRLDPHPRELLRPRRPEAVARSCVDRPRARRAQPVPERAVRGDPHACATRPRCSTSPRAWSPATRSSRRRRLDRSPQEVGAPLPTVARRRADDVGPARMRPPHDGLRRRGRGDRDRARGARPPRRGRRSPPRSTTPPASKRSSRSGARTPRSGSIGGARCSAASSAPTTSSR